MKTMIVWKAVIFTILLTLVPLAHIPYAQGGDDIVFRRITTEHGLPHNEVRAIVQDQQEFMWIATREGLARYDGVDFKIFKHDPDNPNSISDHNLRAMVADP